MTGKGHVKGDAQEFVALEKAWMQEGLFPSAVPHINATLLMPHRMLHVSSPPYILLIHTPPMSAGQPRASKLCHHSLPPSFSYRGCCPCTSSLHSPRGVAVEPLFSPGQCLCAFDDCFFSKVVDPSLQSLIVSAFLMLRSACPGFVERHT